MIGGGERTFISEHDPEGGRKEGGRRSIVTRGDNVERVRCLLKKNPKYAKIHLFDAEGGLQWTGTDAEWEGKGKIGRCYRNASPPLFFPFSHGFHAKQCFHGTVISFSQPTYSPSWPPVFRLSFPSLETPPLSFPWLELTVHFPLYNLGPTSRRRALNGPIRPPPRDNLHRRRHGRVITVVMLHNFEHKSTAPRSSLPLHPERRDARFSSFHDSFHFHQSISKER